MLTSSAKELMEQQKQHMIRAYEKISENVPREELEAAIQTLGKIRGLIEETAGE